MLERISNRITGFLIENNAIEVSEKESYFYFFQKAIGTSSAVLICILIGFLLQRPVEMIAFLILFLYMRAQTGGFHASSPLLCLIFSVSIPTLAILVLPYLMILPAWAKLIVYSVSCMTLFIFAPVNHPNFNGTNEEMSAKSKKMIIVIIIYTVILSVMFYFEALNNLYSTMILSIAFTAALVLLAKILKQEVLNDERT